MSVIDHQIEPTQAPPDCYEGAHITALEDEICGRGYTLTIYMCVLCGARKIRRADDYGKHVGREHVMWYAAPYKVGPRLPGFGGWHIDALMNCGDTWDLVVFHSGGREEYVRDIPEVGERELCWEQIRTDLAQVCQPQV